MLFGRNPRATLVRVAVLIAASVIIFGFVLLPIRLSGISMLPTYRSGGLAFANRLSYLRREPARADVVAIRMAGPNVVYVKRIVGLPGERIEIAMGVVLVDGEPLAEQYVARKRPWNMPEETLGDDEYFVIGDNRAMAMKDHDFGKTTRARILGKLVY